MAEKRPNKVLSYLGLIIFGVGFALIFLEIALRILYPDSIWDDVYMSDPILGHRLRPGIEAWNSSFGEFRIHFRTNSKGLAGEEVDYEKPDGTFRILMLGDSWIQGRHLEEDERTTTQLEAYLNDQEGFPPIEVINAGTDEWGTANEVLFLEHEGLRYDPDLIVLSFLITNDPTDNLRFQDVDWLQEETITVSDLAPVYSTEEADSSEETNEASIVRSLLGAMQWMGRRSYVVRYAVLTLQYNPALLKLLGPLAAGSSVDNEHLIYSPEPTPEIETAWDTTDRILQRYARIGSEQDVPVMVVIWPDAGEYNPEWWERRVTVYPAMEGFDPYIPEARLTEILEENSIRYFSLLPILQATWEEVGDETDMSYWRDGHNTPFTHRVAAEEIGEYLIEEGLIPGE